MMADDGAVTIDASTEASLQMDSAPMSPVDATTVLRLDVPDERGRAARGAVHHLEEGERERGEISDGGGVSGAGGLAMGDALDATNGDAKRDGVTPWACSRRCDRGWRRC